MATNTLLIKDGNGSASALATISSSYGLIPEHTITGAVNVTASAANPVYVTGNLGVDVIVNDLINITSSQGNPVAVTGTINLGHSLSSIFVTSSQNNPVAVTGTLFSTVTSSHGKPVGVEITNNPSVTVSNTPTVTLSSYAFTSSFTNPVAVTGTVQSNITSIPVVTVTSSTGNAVYVTGTVQSNIISLPVTTVTASYGGAVAVTGTVGVANSFTSPLFITSSNNNPVLTSRKTSLAGTDPVVHNIYSVGDEYIDYNSANSGTFVIAQIDTDRKSLIVFNGFSRDLYIVVGSASEGPNGFQMYSTSSAPLKFSFILYPSGTYVAEESSVTNFHAGFFISGSHPFDPSAFTTRLT